jgi:hypothetical protein
MASRNIETPRTAATSALDGGRLRVGLSIDGGDVVAVAVFSTRPQASRILSGKTPGEALALVPRLFSLCGKAQKAVAQAALRAAGADVGATDDWGVRTELVQEHIWRLLLDWPKLLALTAQGGAFVRWYKRFSVATPDQATVLADDLVAYLDADVFPGGAARWLEQGAVASGGGFADALVKGLQALELPSDPGRFLPTASAAEWAARLRHCPPEFALAPTWDGAVAETGAIARQWDQPRVAAARAIGDLVSARLIARLCELAAAPALLRQPSAAIDASPVSLAVGDLGDTAGVAVAQTARGLLLHRVVLANGRIADYQVVAPTEWNFPASGGALAALVGSAAGSPVAALHRARALVLALDPCVPAVVKLDGVGKEEPDA